MSFREFAGVLRRAAEAAPTVAIEAAHLLGKAAESRAKGIIGHKQSSWPTLADSTKAQKARMGFEAPEFEPLLRRGDMRESVSHEVIFGGVLISVVIGSPSKIALYQEMGTAKIPPRPFLALAVVESIPEMETIFGEAAVRLLSPSI